MKASKWLSLVAACTLAASLAACSGGGEEPDGGQPPPEPQGVFRSIGLWAGSIDPDGGPGDRDGLGHWRASTTLGRLPWRATARSGSWTPMASAA